MATEIQCAEQDCETMFTMSEGEENWLREKFGDNFSPPTRCKPCRAKKKARNEARQSTPAPQNFSPTPDNEPRRGRGKRTGKKTRGQKRQRY